MTQPFSTFPQAQRASRAHADQRRAPRYHRTTQSRARTDTHDATSPTHHNNTSASRRVSPTTAHTNKPRTAHRTHTQHTNTQAPHARTTSRTAVTTALRPNITARTPPHTRHTQHGTQLRAPHTPPTENHTQSHTRPPRHTHRSPVRLPSVDGMLPESVLLYKSNDLQDTRTAIASHYGTRRHSRPQPAARDASQCIAQHQSNQVK
jgi:hypothetical protein